MNRIDNSATDAAERGVREAGKPSAQWTDNVVRVHKVLARHPEIEMTWPALTAPPDLRVIVFTARWPATPEDQVVVEGDLGRLADILEREFPE